GGGGGGPPPPPAADPQVPEGAGDDRLLSPFGGDPLDHEAAAEEELAEVAEVGPEFLSQGSISSDRSRSIQRCCIQRTAARSASARQSRLLMLYLGRPCSRGRWLTGISVVRAPAILSSVGRKRCMPTNIGTRRR